MILADKMIALRKRAGWSQEELAEDICDPVTVSRIECGKVSPKRGTYEKLMEKVGLSGSRFDASFPMENPANWKLMMEINRLLNQAKTAEAEPLVEELEQRLSRRTPCDRQMLIQIKTTMLGLQGKISKEDYNLNVENAVKFVTGGSEKIVKDLKKRMELAAEALEFERAADLRDQIKALQKK